MIYLFLEDKYSIKLIDKLKLYSLEYNSLIIEAMKFAKTKHYYHIRKSGEPYYIHPVSVAMLVLDLTKDPEIIAATLLQDVLEDKSTSLDVLKYYFGDRVTSIVYKLVRKRKEGIKSSLQEILDENNCNK